MGLIGLWLNSLDYDYSILSHCSRLQSPRSTCSECVKSCPVDAIEIVDDKPVIDLKSCIECGNCVASCPVQAVEGFLPKRKVIEDQLIMDSESIPTLKELLVYYKKGVTTLICEEDTLDSNWNETINDVNNVLEKLDESPFRVQQEKIDKDELNTMTRRELFFTWEKDLKQVAKSITPAKWRFDHQNLNLSKHYPGYQFANIELDTDKCTLCNACSMLCNENCLEINEDFFSISAQSCTNCSLCQDICPESAITVTQVIAPAEDINHNVLLHTCSSCNHTYTTLNKDEDTCMPCKMKQKFSMM